MAVDKVVYDAVSKKEKFEENLKPPCPKGFGIRHLQALLLFISLTIGYSMRSQIGVLMVAMVDQEAPCNNPVGLNRTYNSNFEENCRNISKWNVYRTYNWSKSTQEMITSALFMGYTSMMIPSGLLAQKYGGKIPFMVALAVNGVVSIFIPWIAVMGGWKAVALSRLLQGMAQAAFFPSIHTILGKWAPLAERGRLSSYIYTGSQFGTVLAYQISGFLASSPLGWPSSFWLFGSLSLISCVLLGWLGAATPHEHPTITAEEITYIMDDGSADITPKKRKTPWRHIVTSKAVWGTIVSHTGSAAGYLLILTEIPMYMTVVLGVDIKSNGVLSSLPYISMYIMVIMFGYLADMLVNKKLMSLVNVRRMANTVGLVVAGVFLIAFSFVRNTTIAIILLVIALGAHSGVHMGFHINYIDLAPNFAGPLMSLGNFIANLTSLLVPVVVSNVVKDDVTNQQKWQIVFLIFCGFQFVTNLVFVIFAKGDVQPWNFYGDEEYEAANDLKDPKKVNSSKNSELPLKS